MTTLLRRPPAPAGVRTGSARLTVTTALALLLAVLGTLVSAGSGDVPVPVGDVLAVVLGGGDPFDRLVVLDLRLPRVAAALVVGASLALAGALLQTVARNPLASPDVLGINAGASVAAVSVVVLAGSAGGVSGVAASLGLPVAALLGALASGALLHLLALRGRQLDPMRLVVVGVGLSAAGASVVSWLLTLGDVAQVGPAIAWLTGSLHAATWPRALAGTWALVIAVLVLPRWSPALGLVGLGDDAAQGLGVAVPRLRTTILLLAVALAGAAVSVGGAVAFLALVAPLLAQHLARTHRPPLLASTAVGAALLVWADLAARQGMSWLGQGPTELPVGVLTAVVGAPYLLYLVSRHRATGRGVS